MIIYPRNPARAQHPAIPIPYLRVYIPVVFYLSDEDPTIASEGKAVSETTGM